MQILCCKPESQRYICVGAAVVKCAFSCVTDAPFGKAVAPLSIIAEGCVLVWGGFSGNTSLQWNAASLLLYLFSLSPSLSPDFITRSDSQCSRIVWVSTIVRVKGCKERSGNEGDGKRNGRRDLLKLPNPYFPPTQTSALSCLIHP